MRAQSMGVALMDARYERDFDAGVDQSDAAAEVIDGLGDPVIAHLSAAANDADHAHDSAVNEHLWPAVKAGDATAAGARAARRRRERHQGVREPREDRRTRRAS